MDKVLVIEVVLSLVCLLSIFIENQLATDTRLNPRLSVLFHYSAFSGFCFCFYFCIFFFCVEIPCWFGDYSFVVAAAVIDVK